MSLFLYRAIGARRYPPFLPSMPGKAGAKTGADEAPLFIARPLLPNALSIHLRFIPARMRLTEVTTKFGDPLTYDTVGRAAGNMLAM